MTSFLISFLELIDTLWNVNEVELSTDELVQQRINRYIMECKWKTHTLGEFTNIPELIDTLWNVNVVC